MTKQKCKEELRAFVFKFSPDRELDSYFISNLRALMEAYGAQPADEDWPAPRELPRDERDIVLGSGLGLNFVKQTVPRA